MKLLFTSLFLISALAFGQESAPPAASSEKAQQQPELTERSKSQAHPMTVLVSITDSGGNPISGFSKDNVHVMDTGQSVPVVGFGYAEPLPTEIVVILYSSHDTFKQQQKAATQFLQQVMRPGKDQAVVLNAGGQKLMQGQLAWESDPAKLAETIKNMDYKVGLPDAFSYRIQIDRAGMQRSDLQIQGGSNTSVFEIAWSLFVQEKRPMRRIVVTFRNPMNHAAGPAGTDQRFLDYVADRHAQIIQAAQTLRAMIFPIITDEPRQNVSGVVDISQGYVPMTQGEASQDQLRHADEETNRQVSQLVSQGRQNVEMLGVQTGGQAFMAPKRNYEDAMSAIANDIKAQYAVTFIPADVTGPRSIKVTAAGATVHAPTSYPHGN